MTDKAVILARGLGTRMRKAADDVALDGRRAELAGRGLKVLMPIHGRPFLDYIVDSLIRAGIRRICFVIAPDADLMRREADRMAKASRAEVTCSVQAKPLGTADAVLAAEAFAAGDSFVMCNGDNLYPDAALARLAECEDGVCRIVAFDRDALVVEGNISKERIRHFAVVTASDGCDLLGIVEKPDDPEQYARDGRLWVNMNLYRFTPGIFDACRSIEPDPDRGELELTAAVATMLESEEGGFLVEFCSDGVLDLTTRADVGAVEAALVGRELSF